MYYFTSVENWLPVIAATLVGLVVGFIWYNPKLFGNSWMKALGMKEENLKSSSMPMIYIITIILSFLMAVFIRKMVAHGEEESITFQHGLYHTMWPTLFLIVPVIVINALFERRNLSYTLISAGYWAATILIMGGILSIWR